MQTEFEKVNINFRNQFNSIIIPELKLLYPKTYKYFRIKIVNGFTCKQWIITYKKGYICSGNLSLRIEILSHIVNGFLRSKHVKKICKLKRKTNKFCSKTV